MTPKEEKFDKFSTGNYTQEQKDAFKRDYGEELPDHICECGNPIPQCSCPD